MKHPSSCVAVITLGAIGADYERTRLSGNSPWNRGKRGLDERAVADVVKQGDELFFGKADCSQCHRGQNFTDSAFHNLGVGPTCNQGRR